MCFMQKKNLKICTLIHLKMKYYSIVRTAKRKHDQVAF